MFSWIFGKRLRAKISMRKKPELEITKTVETTTTNTSNNNTTNNNIENNDNGSSKNIDKLASNGNSNHNLRESSSNGDINGNRSSRRSLRVTRTPSMSRNTATLIVVADPLQFSQRTRSDSEDSRRRRGSIFQCELEAKQMHTRTPSQSIMEITAAMVEGNDDLVDQDQFPVT